LGLLTADFGDHPVGHALLPWVAALRARSGLEVICVASDSNEKKHPGSALRRAIAAACTAFYDVTELPDVEAALLINELRIHVLLNLVGHTAGARHVLTQWQPAPVQGLHYGYPATTALPAMGYMQVDRVATPPELQSDFTERLAYFPHCHFIAVHAERYPHVQRVTAHAHPWTGDRRVIAADGAAARRSDLGLGPVGSRHDAFALCNFNQLYKLDPETFEAWANALRRLPRAFLWLSRVSVRKDTSMFAEANLQLEAAALGIDTPRLAFSFRFGEKDYVPFRALADLMVDNRNYNAHTTGADTLWAGVPAVMIEGGHLAGRAGATFSSALGTASMLAESIRAYEDGTYLLGTGPARLHALRRRLLQKRVSAPFFDLARLARGQHRLATLMWGVYAAGLRPMHVIASR
jgi:predicted O-linked N-acetylglucosamine transferase (SPINDLY family)